jgi:hypothetical protein
MKLEALAGAPAAGVPPVPPVPKAAGAATARKAAPPPPPPPPADHADDGGADLDGLYALAAVEKQAQKAGAIDDSPRCPKCFSELGAGAVLCTNCGFDLRSRKQITVQTGDPKAQAKAAKGGGLFGSKGGGSKPGKKDKMAPQGSFLVGMACCAGFAIAGALIWFLIGYYTGYSIGFVAMGVGALAGVGMQIGQKGYSKLGGVVAAAMTLVAIVIANIAIAVVVLAHPGGDTKTTKQEAKLEEQVSKLDTELEKYDERVVMQFEEDYNKQQRAAGKKSSDELDEDESDTRYLKVQVEEKQAVLDKLKAMPKTDYDAMIAKLDEQEERQELISHLTEEEMNRRGVSYRQSSYEDHLKASQELAHKQVDPMTREQVKAALGPLQAKAEADQKKRVEDFQKDMKAKGLDEDGGASTAVRTTVFIVILLLIFGWKTIWFVILAMFFAYRTASGGVSG